MSSFRIDRQYVSFETAETQPVHAANKMQKAETAATNDINAYNGDISKIYNEIYERLQNEHAEQAEYMLSKAADEAQDIVDKAKSHAEKIVNQARSEAEKLRDELVGEMEATSIQIKSHAEIEFNNIETKLRNDYSGLVDGMRGNVIALVMEIVKKIIGIKLSQSDEIFMGIIKDALEQLKQTGSVLIRVSPEDYLRYFGNERGDLENDEIKITVVEDLNFKSGDLIVESEGEMIDLSINRQIDQIEKAFLN